MSRFCIMRKSLSLFVSGGKFFYQQVVVRRPIKMRSEKSLIAKVFDSCIHIAKIYTGLIFEKKLGLTRKGIEPHFVYKSVLREAKRNIFDDKRNWPSFNM